MWSWQKFCCNDYRDTNNWPGSSQPHVTISSLWLRLLCKYRLRLAGNDKVAPHCNHHITRRGHKWVGGDNTTRDTDAVLQSSLIRLIFTNSDQLQTQWNILSLMLAACPPPLKHLFAFCIQEWGSVVTPGNVILLSGCIAALHRACHCLRDVCYRRTKITFDHQHSHKRLLYCQIHSSAIRDKSHVSRVMSWACYMSQC